MENKLILEVVDGYHMPKQRQNGEKTFTEQTMYMHNGGPFPVEVAISLKAPVHALPIGKYTLSPKAFRASKYGKPELNPWELADNLIPVDDAKIKKVV